jgi:Rieske Fe-S protein
MTISRREFIKLTGTTVVCTCLGVTGTSGCAARPTSNTPCAPVGSYRIGNNTVILVLSKVEALREVGGAVKLTLNDKDDSELKIIVVHAGDQDYRAFADRCTHNGKELNYLHAEEKLACSGLSSQFDLEGNVIRGPAEDGLFRYHLRQEDEELLIEIR